MMTGPPVHRESGDEERGSHACPAPFAARGCRRAARGASVEAKECTTRKAILGSSSKEVNVAGSRLSAAERLAAATATNILVGARTVVPTRPGFRSRHACSYRPLRPLFRPDQERPPLRAGQAVADDRGPSTDQGEDGRNRRALAAQTVTVCWTPARMTLFSVEPPPIAETVRAHKNCRPIACRGCRRTSLPGSPSRTAMSTRHSKRRSPGR